MSFEEISMEMFFCYSFIYSFKFSLSGSTGCVPSPPEKSRQLPPHALHLHYVLYSYIIFANDFLLPHRFTFSSETVSFVRLQHVYVFWYTSKTNPTEFQGKSNTGSVHTCVYVTKSAGKWFWFWRTFKPASSSIWFFLIHLFFYFCLRKETVMQSTSVNTNLPALSQINHYFTLKKKEKKKRVKVNEGRGGWRSEDEEQCVGGEHSLTKAAF